MADELWKISEDGYLDLEVECNSITYHPNLNIVLVLSKSSEVLVIDVNSGLLLQRTVLSANLDGKLQATYLAGHDKILLLDERGVGIRTDYNGVLLLDTILQTPVTKADDIVKLELLISEAVLLEQTLRTVDLPGVEHTREVVHTLTNQIELAHQRPKKGIKAQKWNTVCLELPHCYLKWVCSGLVSELKRQNKHIPALSIASAVNERLNSLLPIQSEGQPVDRALMFSEAMRRQTFTKWPHMNYKWALPDQMAQAGFYHQPNSAGDDRAMCFTCIVCLVCWEPSDEPWSEHERHSPTCSFVKGEYTQNVPLSVTYATAPAIQTDSPMDILGTSSVPELIPTATSTGHITIWNCSRQLKSEATISVVSKSSVYSDLAKKKEAWADQDVVEIPLSETTIENLIGAWSGGQEVRLGAVSVVSEGTARPVLVAGVSLARHGPAVSPLVRAMNNVNLGVDIMKVVDTKPSVSVWQPHIVVYDFHYHADADSMGGDREGSAASAKAQVSGTGTSASRQENTNMYSDIFLSKFLYTGPTVMHEAVIDDVVYQTQEMIVNDTFPAPSSSSSINCPVPLGVAVPTAGGGTFDTSMAINEGLDMTNFPSTSNGSPLVSKLLDRDSSSNFDSVTELSNANGLESSELLTQEPVPLQSVSIDTQDRPLVISGLHPTRDGKHLLVVLSSGEEPGGQLLLYKLQGGGPGGCVTLETAPKVTHSLEQDLVSLTLLPLEGDVSATPSPLGTAAAVTRGGLLALIDIATLTTSTTTSTAAGTKFVSVTYCNSLERVCAASEKGSLHFFTLHDEEFGKSEESIFAEGLENNFCSPRQSVTKETPLLVNAPTLDLTALYELTRFENLVPCFAATVPACWTELMQAQKQRRHPQHLQHADDVHHTRSWRLQNDLCSWDEHLFELTLPRSVCVGHVDLKFSLQAQCQTTQYHT